MYFVSAPTKPLNLDFLAIPLDTQNVSMLLSWDTPASPNGIVRKYSARWNCTPDAGGNATSDEQNVRLLQNTTGVIVGLPIDSNCTVELAAVTISTGEFASVNVTTPYMGNL